MSVIINSSKKIMWWFRHNKVPSASVENKLSAFALVAKLVVIVLVFILVVLVIFVKKKKTLSVNCVRNTAKHYTYIIIFNSLQILQERYFNLSRYCCIASFQFPEPNIGMQYLLEHPPSLTRFLWVLSWIVVGTSLRENLVQISNSWVMKSKKV